MHIDLQAQALLEPVRATIDAGLAALGVPAPAAVRVAEVEGFFAMRGEDVVLAASLVASEQRHPDDAGPNGLDRWRRGAASVLEGAVLAALPSGGPAWLRAGLAIHRVDRAVPELRLGPAALGRASGGDLGASPRGGVAVLRAWEAAGDDAEAKAMAAIEADKVGVKDFVDAGGWVLGSGLAAEGVVLERPAPLDIPCDLPPWSWRRLQVPAHHRGGRVRVTGRGGVAPAWAKANEAFTALAGACEDGAAFAPDAGGPVGRWEIRSAEGFGQVLGGRGVQFTFHSSGKLEVVLADAFVGGLGDVEASESIGTSGMIVGRWTVAGPRKVRLHDLAPAGVTLHGRGDEAFAMPSEGLGLAASIRAMQDGIWSWRQDAHRMWLEGQMFGGKVAIRLEDPWGQADA